METQTLEQAKLDLKKRGFLNIDTPGINYATEIKHLKKEKNAVILAHYYQEGSIQNIGDFVGDSLQLAQEAAKTNADIIVFAGVHFMVETAKILNPNKTVVLPDLYAGCSLADSCPPDAFKIFKDEHPDHMVVTYINCSAEIKALSDIVCTSSNALKIINSIPENQPIIFAPDKNLGTYLINETGRDMLLWDGACMVHEAFSIEKLFNLAAEHPDAEIIAHPESQPHILKTASYIGSTAGLLKHVRESDKKKFKQERELYKRALLASMYGQKEGSLSIALNISFDHAAKILADITSSYETYFRWVDRKVSQGARDGYMKTKFGWRRNLTYGEKINKRSLFNFMCQGHGSEMLRLALIDLTEKKFEVNALVHDGILLHIKRKSLRKKISQIEKIMTDAAKIVLGNKCKMRVDFKVIRGNFKQDEIEQKKYERIFSKLKKVSVPKIGRVCTQNNAPGQSSYMYS